MSDDNQPNFGGGSTEYFGSGPYTGGGKDYDYDDDDVYEGGSMVSSWRIPNGSIMAVIEGLFIFTLLVTIAYLSFGSNGVPGLLIAADIVIGAAYVLNEWSEYSTGKDLVYSVTKLANRNAAVAV